MSSRFFLDSSFDPKTVELAGSEAHHLIHVMRLELGERVDLFDGRGTEAVAEICSIGRRTVTLEVLERRHRADDVTTSITLAAAVPRGDRLRWMVEKLAELGVRRFIPLQTERSVVVPGSGKLGKLHQTVIAAAKQSGQSRLMDIAAVTTWSEFVEAQLHDVRALVAHPGGRPMAACVWSADRRSPLVLCVGPEGGFTDRERDQATAAGAVAVSLGAPILRIETAAIAMAAAAMLNCQENEN